MIVSGSLTGGALASFAMYTMSVSSGVGGTMKVYARIMEVVASVSIQYRRWAHRSESSSFPLPLCSHLLLAAESIASIARRMKRRTMRSPIPRSSKEKSFSAMCTSPILKSRTIRFYTTLVADWRRANEI